MGTDYGYAAYSAGKLISRHELISTTSPINNKNSELCRAFNMEYFQEFKELLLPKHWSTGR